MTKTMTKTTTRFRQRQELLALSLCAAALFLLPVRAWGGSNQEPVFELPGQVSAGVARNLDVLIQVSDPDGDPLTVGVEGLPSGATFDPVTRRLRWSPVAGQEGLYFAKVSASDGTTAVVDWLKVVVFGWSARVPTGTFAKSGSMTIPSTLTVCVTRPRSNTCSTINTGVTFDFDVKASGPEAVTVGVRSSAGGAEAQVDASGQFTLSVRALYGTDRYINEDYQGHFDESGRIVFSRFRSYSSSGPPTNSSITTIDSIGTESAPVF